MINLFGGIIGNGSAKFIADFFTVIFKIFGRTFLTRITNILALIFNLITKYVWFICQFVLAVMDVMQLAFTKILGIDTGTGSSMGVEELVTGLKEIVVPGGGSFYDQMMKIFRAGIAVAIILMIIFTIVAMVMQEYTLAVNGYSKADNKKGKFIKVIFTNIITIFLIPLIFYTIIAGSSAILTSFYRAFGNTSDVTIAGNVLAASTYDANRYRAYANAGQRLPITISVYSMENSFGAPRGDEELLKEIEDNDVQKKLQAIAGAFANNSFLPFKKSTLYENGTWSNYKNYSYTLNNTVYDDLGDYFENFICTREQYYVLADFVDYCQLYNLKYYVKAMSESDICWKYVDNITGTIDGKGNALGDITLNIRYRDASVVNMESSANAADATSSDGYDLQITTKVDMTSPISDALTAASKLLGIDEATSGFNTMERDDSGDFVNLVNWSTQKVKIQLSSAFALNNPSTWNYSDQIIIYEYFRFQNEFSSTNNVFEDYTLAQLQSEEGVELDALEMTYRNYNSNTHTYADPKTLYCVKLNNTYYRVEKSEEVDGYGHAYYKLAVKDENIDYFTDVVVSIEYKGETNLQLSSTFNINDPSSWKTIDQVLIYEYFKDLSLSNGIVRDYPFTAFNTGVDFKVYSIDGTNYVYINGTYYQQSTLSGSGAGTFLTNTESIQERWFIYTLSAQNQSQYGVSGLGSLIASVNDNDFVEVDDVDGMYQKYSSMNFKLSKGFSFYNSDTWTFRDYSIIYIYLKMIEALGTLPAGSSVSVSVESLQHLGFKGAYGRVDSTYYLKVPVTVTSPSSTDQSGFDTSSTDFYINLENLSRTSELKITQTLAPDIFEKMHLGINGVDLVTTYSKLESEKLLMSPVETHHFELSQGFEEYDASTWTVGDYLLLYATRKGIINADISLIEIEGYTSLIYNNSGSKYYRIGRENDSAALFIDETAVCLIKGYDVNKFFNTNLVAFLLANNYSNINIRDLIIDEDDFGGNALIDISDYLVDLSLDLSSTKSLQNLIANDLISELNLLSNDISLIEYTYSNPEIDINDLTTWKYLDLIILNKTGNLPTTQEPFKSYIYSSGSEQYLLIRDIKNTDKPLKAISNTITIPYDLIYDNSTPRQATDAKYREFIAADKTASSANKFGSEDKFDLYYDSILKNTAGIKGSKPANYDNSKDVTVYYYSDKMAGGAGKRSTDLSAMDMIIIKNDYDTMAEPGSKTYKFSGKNINGTYYIYVNDSCYVKLAQTATQNNVSFETYEFSEYDVFVNISSGNYKCQGSGTVATKLQLRSDESRTFDLDQNFNIYYSQFIKHANTSEIDNFSSAPSATAYYYSAALKSSSRKTKTTPFLTDLDMYLIQNNYTPNSKGYYTFEAKRMEDVLYIRPSGSSAPYIAISKNQSAKMFYLENALIPASDSPFSLETDTYTSFVQDATNGYTKFDAMLYSIVGSSVSVEYKKYKYRVDSSIFICVNNKFIKLDSALTGSYCEVSDPSDIADKDKYIAYLYENFYSSYASQTAPNSVVETYNGINGKTNDWYVGLNVILNTKGMGTGTSGFRLLKTSEGSYYLFKNNWYINLAGLASVKIGTTGGAQTITLDSLDKESAKWRILNSVTVSGELVANTPYYVEDTASNDLSGKFKVSDIVTSRMPAGDTTFSDDPIVDLSKVKETLLFSSTNLSDIETQISTWRYIDLLSAYFDRENSYKTLYKFQGRDGKNYIMFERLGEKVVVPENLTGSASIYSYIFSYSSTTSGGFSGTLAEKWINDNGYDFNDGELKTSTIKFEKADGTGTYDCTIFIVSKGTKRYAIYGLENVAVTAAASDLKVLYIDQSDSNKIKETEDINQGELFSVEVRDMKYLTDWSVIELALSYATDAVNGTHISSKLYKFNSKYYIKFEDQYILIPIRENIQLEATNSSYGKILTDSTAKYNVINNISMKNEGKSLIKDKNNYSAISQDIRAFETSKLVNSDGGSSIRLKFSEKFDVRDYSTWKVSDYVLYYCVVNGFYEANTPPISIPFSYVPDFRVSGNSVAGLTFFDLALAASLGSTVEDGHKVYNYINNPEASYQFYVVRDADYKYYIRIDDGHYVPLSDVVYTDYSETEIISPKLNESLSLSVTTLLEAKVNDSGVVDIVENGTISATILDNNFQTLANAHGAVGYTHYLLKQNPDTGSADYATVVEFSGKRGSEGMYFKYDTLFNFTGKSFSSYVSTVKENDLTIQISTSKQGTYSIKMKYDNVYPDLYFKNYYYFNENVENFNSLGLFDVDKDLQEKIMQGNSNLEKLRLNLKLSTTFNASGSYVSGFKIEDTSTWTVLDYIIMKEFARDDINHNKFRDMPFDELYDDYFVELLADRSDEANVKFYLYLNGNIYNLSGHLVASGSEGVYVSNTTKINQNVFEGGANINNYSYRVLRETVNLSFHPDYTGNVKYDRDKENISYKTSSNITVFRYIDTEILPNYRIITDNFGKYSVEKLIKKVSWVEKLMTDMQVYYPDLNWGVLLATDGWLDTLGDFTSAHTSGLITGGDNSANTTAAGLVLSEFFMSVATPVVDSYADYEYSSVFDEATLKSLMLSLMGEENYNALVLEAEVFMDYFNSCFAPIIDDFAKEFGESIGENSLRLCAYKSYLATMLLSSDIGQYLYTVATRVYAEYTIGEYLANAGNDYSNYYGYVNYLKDENGNEINAFNYGTFVELVKYENEYCGHNTPTFTFNVKQAFDHFKDENGLINGVSYEVAISTDSNYSALVRTLYLKLDEEYKNIYMNLEYEISDQGQIIDKSGLVVKAYEKKSYTFCYMLHVYWAIMADIPRSAITPTYLKYYKNYLDGDLYRWSILSDDSIEGADVYFETANQDKSKMSTYKTLTSLNAMRLFIPTMALGEPDDDGFLGRIEQFLGAFSSWDSLQQSTIVPMADTNNMFSGNSQAKKSLEFIKDYALTITFVMGFSEDSTFDIVDAIKELINKYLPFDLSVETSWNTVVAFRDNLDVIITELREIRNILPGETTIGGSDRKIRDDLYYTDAQIDQILSSFQDVKTNVDQYIIMQQRLDAVQKRSITFTLAQYGANYVSSGYQFSVRNKDYTFKSSADPSRLAEYVYGGAFLNSVGVGAQYTSNDYTGMVYASKVYDNVDKVLKTEIITWPQLRAFASNIADKTAELYFLTNLKDIDVGNVNAITFGSGSAGSTMQTYLTSFITTQFTTNLGEAGKTDLFKRTGSDFKSLTSYLFGEEINVEELDNMTFEEYKRIALRMVIENKNNPEETPEERANKYMTRFNLLSVQFDFYGDGVYLGRSVTKGQLRDVSATGVSYSANYSAGTGARSSTKYYLSQITATGSHSNSTIDIIKTMSGLENRPTHEVLTREYSGTRPTNYYDEAYGDTFIICTYHNGLYYPVLASGSKSCGGKYLDFYTKIEGNDDDEQIMEHKFTSEYLDIGSYVIVAKGIITPDGLPTAIRKYNNPIEIERKRLLGGGSDIYNAVTYYRTNVGANFGEGSSLINASRAASRVTTKNYTRYVYGTNFTTGIGGTTTYTGRTDLKTIVSSDYNSNFVQSKIEYLTSQSDEFGGISVLDEFSYFYIFGPMTWILLMLAFVTIIPVMVNAVGGVISRMFDMIILFMVSPFVISTNSFYVNGKNQIFNRWKKNIQTVLWSALGYIIGFSSFAILVPIVLNVNAFVDIGTYNAISKIGGLTKILTFPRVNMLVRYLWVVTAVSILERMPKLLLPILTANNGDLASPHPGLGGGGQKFTDKAKAVTKDLENTLNKMSSIITGKALLGALQSAKDTALNMIPGYALGKELKEKVIDPVKNAVQNQIIKAEEAAIQKLLIAKGFDPKVAKAAASAVGKAQKAKMNAKDEQKKRMDKYKADFEKTFK